MYVAWTKHLQDTKEKEDFKRTVYGSKTVLERLTSILNEMETDLNTVEISPKTYEVPNWDYRQAHNNGYRQCLNILKKLINLDQQKEEIDDRQSTSGRQFPITSGPPAIIPKRVGRRPEEIQNS